MKKALFIFAGANGSGKTTLYKRHKEIFADLPFVNADEILKNITGNNDPTNAKFGQDLAQLKIEECFANEESRVKRRAELGGHDVPEEKVLARIPRTLKNVKKALSFVDDFYIFDNDYVSGHQLVAYKKPLSAVVVNPDAPDWARALTRKLNELVR